MVSSLTSETKSRLAELDALRGIAAMAVLLFHYTARYHQLYPAEPQALFSLDLGQYGVNLFFMISGFVISMTLVKTNRALDFVVSRFSRLFPTYWVAVLVTSLALVLFGSATEVVTLPEIMANFTMIQGFFHVRSIDGVYWTLEVELLFYFAALVLFLTGQFRKPHWVLAVWLALSILYYSRIGQTLVADSKSLAWVARLLILDHIAFFILGICFYRLYNKQKASIADIVLVTVAVATIFLFKPLALSLLTLLFCAIFFQISLRGLPFLCLRPLLFLGTISYPLYLLHQKIGYLMLLTLSSQGLNRNIGILVTALGIILLASMVTFLVERPAMRFIRNTYRARARLARWV